MKPRFCLQGVGFFENECVSTQTKNCTQVKEILSDYRNESQQDGLVELRETDDTISWGWTSSGEWLGYSVTVSQYALHKCFLPLLCDQFSFQTFILSKRRVVVTIKCMDCTYQQE